ncbi:hypothetical protein CONLIGDRAFT_685750 [Coniochaeta ligniaria NRRL 30616]|uniref:Uncharacterized protein n=1 Tax=Coniochaeta ligniaria NRRL 30616 TaxID=1408157 RepID=A0A1J7I9I5_9PEZI|nr:hypothetical protein CONLIGDRAFT_685750 [Coniochaeta ligniaria NRRL 30616]
MKDFEFPTEVEHIMVYDRMVSRKVIVKGSEVTYPIAHSDRLQKTVTTFGKIMSDNVMGNPNVGGHQQGNAGQPFDTLIMWSDSDSDSDDPYSDNNCDKIPRFITSSHRVRLVVWSMVLPSAESSFKIWTLRSSCSLASCEYANITRGKLTN